MLQDIWNKDYKKNGKSQKHQILDKLSVQFSYHFFQWHSYSLKIKFRFNRFSTNVPLMYKPGSWFLLAKCLEKPVGEWHIAGKNQLTGFYISGILVKNGLNSSLLMETNPKNRWFIHIC